MSYFLEKNRYVALSLLGAILGYLAWPPSYFSPLIFITFVPLLWLSNELSHQKNKQSQRNTAILLFFLLWNSSVTWWMQKATLVGFLSAAVCNALFMCIPFLLFLRTQKKMGNYLGYLSFILYWLSMEYLHHNWELAWPWLTLGNVFALYPQYIQWYSITGVAGGSLWVLSVNVLVFLSLKQYVLCHYQWRNKQFLTKLSQTLLLIFIPIIFSLGLFYNYQEKGTPVEITVVQPNINPYTEKFRGSTYKKQMQRLFSLSEAATTPNTRFVLWPETAIPGRVWFETIGKSAYISQIENWLSTYNSLSIITGATVLKAYNNKPNSLKQKIQQKRSAIGKHPSNKIRNMLTAIAGWPPTTWRQKSMM